MPDSGKELIKEVESNLPKLLKEHKKLGDAFLQRLAPAAMSDGALTMREKELIAVALGINGQCNYCIAVHIEKALALGVTKEEIAEVCGVSVLMGGGPALMYAGKAMAILEDLSKENVTS